MGTLINVSWTTLLSPDSRPWLTMHLITTIIIDIAVISILLNRAFMSVVGVFF